jgi:hypothetical protein
MSNRTRLETIERIEEEIPPPAEPEPPLGEYLQWVDESATLGDLATEPDSDLAIAEFKAAVDEWRATEGDGVLNLPMAMTNFPGRVSRAVSVICKMARRFRLGEPAPASKAEVYALRDWWRANNHRVEIIPGGAKGSIVLAGGEEVSVIGLEIGLDALIYDGSMGQGYVGVVRELRKRYGN